MREFSSVSRSVPDSGVRAIMERALRMPEVIRLEVGEPEFAPPAHVVEAVARYVRDGHTHYVANAGIAEVREVAAAYLSRLAGTAVDAAEVMVTGGAMQGLSHAFNILLDPGDEVLLPDPGWPNYTMAARLREAQPVYYPLRPEREFLPDVADLERRVTPRCRALLICTPSNPTGQVLDAARLEALAHFATRHDLFVIADEVYAEIVFEGAHVSALQFLDPARAVGVFGVSKSHAMTGFRIGFTRASPGYVRLAANLQEATTSCPTAFSQLAAVDALLGPQDAVVQMRDAYRSRRDLALAILRENGLYRYTPRGAFYLLVDVSASGLGSHAFALRLLEQARVAVAPGDTFGEVSAQHVRISLASAPAAIEEGLRRLCRALREGMA